MISSRSGFTAVLLTATAGIIAGAVGWAQPAPKPVDKDKQALAGERLKAVQKTYDLLFEPSRKGLAAHPDQESVYVWSRRWREAELDAATTAEARRAAHRGHRDRMKELMARHVDPPAGIPTSPFRKTAAETFLAEAEFWLARAAAE